MFITRYKSYILLYNDCTQVNLCISLACLFSNEHLAQFIKHPKVLTACISIQPKTAEIRFLVHTTQPYLSLKEHIEKPDNFLSQQN